MILVDKLVDWLFDEFVKPRLPKVADWLKRHRRQVLTGTATVCLFAFIVWQGYPLVKLRWAKKGSLTEIESSALVARASSSSTEARFLVGDNTLTVNYSAANLIDGKLETAWQVNDGGIGQSVEISWSNPRRLGRIRVVPGYLKESTDKWGDRWTLNNRVKEVTVDAYLKVFGPLKWKVWSKPMAFADERTFQSMDIDDGVLATSVQLTIRAIYPSLRSSPETGKPIHDTCISEIELLDWR